MKIAVVYESLTGNTAQLADVICGEIPENALIFRGAPGELPEADLYIVGSWTDKGQTSKGIMEFLSKLKNVKIAYFATVGFGGSEAYYETIHSRVLAAVDESNTVVGKFYCQGKMPASVRARYAAMAEKEPENPQWPQMLENFDAALTHPDGEDLRGIRKWIHTIL